MLIPAAAWMVHLPWLGEVLPASQTVGGIAAALAALALITALGCVRLGPPVWRNERTMTFPVAQELFHDGALLEVAPEQQDAALARVGYASRFVDALFALSLLARGSVPGGTAAAAALAYERLQSKVEGYRYYGQVVRWEGWIILQYWFFYAFNNWRSGFSGVNDHEADWEMVTLYLYEPAPGDIRPEWVAYASHDFYGDDLRRRWDDPEIRKVGEHPVIYAGAGSHASYFAPGECMAELEIPFLRPLVRLMGWARQRRQKAREEVYFERRMNRIAELWAAMRIGGLFVGVALLALFSPRHLVVGLGCCSRRSSLSKRDFDGSWGSSFPASPWCWL